MTSRNRTTAFCLLGVAATLFAGCGDDKPEQGRSAASAVVSDAAQKTLAQGSARQKLDLHTEPARQLAFVIDGIVDLRGDHSRGRILYRQFPGVEAGTKVDQIQFQQVDYFRPEGESTWLKTKTTPDDELNNSTDVPSSLKHLGTVMENAKVEGRETLAGERTTRYSGTIDVRKVAETTPQEHRDRQQERVEQFKDPRLPVQIWISERGFVSRVRYDIPFANLKVAGGGEKTMVIEIALSDFGTPADIKAPPASQTEEE